MRKMIIIALVFLLLLVKYFFTPYWPILAYVDIEIAFLAIFINNFKNINFILALVIMGIILDLKNVFYPLGITTASTLIVYLLGSIISSWHFSKSVKFSLIAVGLISILKYCLIGLLTKQYFNIAFFQAQYFKNLLFLLFILFVLNLLSRLVFLELQED